MEDDKSKVIEELQKELDFYQQKIKDLDEIVVKKKLVEEAKKKINLYLLICGFVVIIVFALFSYKEFNLIKSLDIQKNDLEKISRISKIDLKSYVEKKIKEIETIHDEFSNKIIERTEKDYFNKTNNYNSELEERKMAILKQLDAKEKIIFEMVEEETEKLVKQIDNKVDSASKKIDEKTENLSSDFEKQKITMLKEITKEINNTTVGIEPKLDNEIQKLIKSYDEYIISEINSSNFKASDKINGWVYFGELEKKNIKDKWNFRNFLISFTKSKYPKKGNQITLTKDVVNVRENYFEGLLSNDLKNTKIIGKIKKGSKFIVSDVHLSENGKHVWVKIKN